MKKIIPITTLITALVFLSCGSNTTSAKETTEPELTDNHSNGIPDFTKSFKGTVNNKYEITMSLTKKASNLTGTYAYKSQGTPIKITGTIDEKGNLTINEYNDKGNMTGIFKGQLSGKNINGHWDKPDGSKTMPFSLAESASAVMTTTKTEKEDLTKWTGTYQLGQTSGKLTVTGPAADGAVKFILSQGGNCIEEPMEGTAYLTSQSVANWQEQGGQCHLSFTFNPGSIQVIESDCGMHGASCGTYDGFYNKKK